ncbi:MAG: SDR family NAD(P)-dependent oxidoreductase [Leptospiraceae bacterium]|nr:SDR family NAD(P)-dependent oxidoreductase [Leptospiraceae bacterium]MCP5493828.1 SDR family NAD(P)-dependent oxidoreductase [Leptospiraceae bacterium]
MSKKVIVVGASSGLGLEIAKELLQTGYTVTLVARREDELKKVANEFQNAHIIRHDVTNFDEIDKLFQKSVDTMGGLDEIYYTAGILEKVAIDEFNTAKDLSMLNVNTLGAISWLNPAAKYFQERGQGKIIGISSIAGDRGRVGNPVYNTSKAAFTTYLEAIRNRLSKKGVQVLTVRPGFIDTDMTKGMEGLLWLISANKAAKIIIRAAQSGKEDIYVPARWRLVSFIICSIPSFIFKKLSV